MIIAQGKRSAALGHEPKNVLFFSFLFGARAARQTERTNQPNPQKMKPKPKTQSDRKITDGAQCKVIAGVHAGKSGTVRDINTSKTGHLTITVVQADGECFKTLAKNVVT
jgi:hypothetical protein